MKSHHDKPEQQGPAQEGEGRTHARAADRPIADLDTRERVALSLLLRPDRVEPRLR